MSRGLYWRLILFNLFTSGFCITAQFTLNSAMSYVLSNSIFIYSLYTGIYLMAMGLGVLVVEKLKVDSQRIVSVIFFNALLALVLSNPGILGVLFLNEGLIALYRNHDVNLMFLTYPAGIFLTVCLGMVSGAEIPLFSKLFESMKQDSSKPLIAVLTSDYLGAFAGTLLFTLLLLPFLGLVRAIVVAQAVLLLMVDYMFFYLKLYKSRFFLVLTVILNILLLILFLLRNHLLNWLDALSY